MTQLILFTDLDNDLFNSLKQDSVTLLPTLQALRALHIPVIPVTNRTRAEVTPLQQHLNLTGPLIIENGSGIFIPKDTPIPDLPGDLEDGYHLIELGCPYVQSRAGLRVLANELHHPLLGFGDMTIERLQNLTGMTATEAQQTKEREFSEPFMTPKAVSPEELVKAAQRIDFQIIVGEPFSYLIGAEAGKAKGIQTLVQLYQTALPAPETLTTVGLSPTANDTDLLTAVDIPILLPHPTATGWITAIQEACQQAGISL